MVRWYCAIICVYAYVSFHYIVIVPLRHLVSEFLIFFCLLWSMNYLITDRCDSNKISYFQMGIPLNKFPLETSLKLPICF